MQQNIYTFVSQFQVEKFYFSNMTQKSWIILHMKQNGHFARDYAPPFWHHVLK